MAATPTAVEADAFARTDSQAVAQASLAATHVPQTDVPEGWLTGLEKGHAYAAFRTRALANGWTPVASAACMANVVGANHDSLCAGQAPPAICMACTQIPELNACSGDGYCETQFSHTGTQRIMQVDTYGSVVDWKQPGSGMRVTGWHFADAPDE